MDRANISECDFSDDCRMPSHGPQDRKKWKKRKSFARKSRKASRPATYMGQRSNSHPRSKMQ